MIEQFVAEVFGDAGCGLGNILSLLVLGRCGRRMLNGRLGRRGSGLCTRLGGRIVLRVFFDCDDVRIDRSRCHKAAGGRFCPKDDRAAQCLVVSCIGRREEPLVAFALHHLNICKVVSQVLAIFIDPFDRARNLSAVCSETGFWYRSLCSFLCCVQFCICKCLVACCDFFVKRCAGRDGLLNRDSHCAGRFCIDIAFHRRELPCCLIITHLIHCCLRRSPCKCTCNRLTAVGRIGHCTGKRDCRELFAVGQFFFAERKLTIQRRNYFIDGIDIDCQCNVTIVCCFNGYRHRTDLTRSLCFYRLNWNHQITVLEGRGIIGLIVISTISKLNLTECICYLAVFAWRSQLRQHACQINGIRRRVLVCNL